MIINTNDYGGAGIAALRLHQALLEQKIDSHFLCLNKSKSTVPKCESFFKNKAKLLFRILHRIYLVKYAYERNKNLINGKTGDFEIFSFSSMDYDISAHPLVKDADIIHLHWVADFLDWKSFFKNVDKPIVWTLHDMNPFLGGFHYLGDKKRNFLIFNALEEKLISTKIFALRKVSQLHIVCPSKWLQQQSMKSEIFGAYKHYVIPNSIPVNTFRPLDKLKSRQVFNLPLEKKIILFVADSVDNHRKGFSLLQKALQYIDDHNYALAIVGRYTAIELNQRISAYHLGYISDEVLLASAYSAADIFVIPSVEDNLPNTVIESLACGTPVVAFNVGGLPDLISNGINGFIAEKINVEELYQAIVKALNYDFTRSHIRNNAVSKFKPSIQVSKYMEIYKASALKTENRLL